MAHNIYFFSNFGDLNRLASGGGEAASRRLWHTMESQGFTVKIFNRHRFENIDGILFRLLLVVWAVLDPILLFFKLLFCSRKESVFLFRTYSGTLLIFDLAISLAAKLAGHKMVLCIAGGRAKPDYDAGNSMYKRIFCFTLGLYAEVFCEGQVTCELVKEASRGKVKSFYFPNYTAAGFAPSVLPLKPVDSINIIYFGRVCRNKEVLLGIEVFNKLCQKYHSLRYTIIGNGDQNYCKMVEEAIQSSPYRDRIERFPISSHDFIIDKLKTQHIFLFPSNEHCEGHSNSLNEAMSWGVVPVVSDINFLPGIVGTEELVVHGYSVDGYVEKISSIIDSGALQNFSEYVFERVKNNFTQNIVQDNLKKELERI